MENWKSVVKLHKAHEKADTAFHASQNWWSTKGLGIRLIYDRWQKER